MMCEIMYYVLVTVALFVYIEVTIIIYAYFYLGPTFSDAIGATFFDTLPHC